MAQVIGTGTWKDKADRDIMPFGMTYTLRLTGDGWRIVAAVIHAPDAALDR